MMAPEQDIALSNMERSETLPTSKEEDEDNNTNNNIDNRVPTITTTPTSNKKHSTPLDHHHKEEKKQGNKMSNETEWAFNFAGDVMFVISAIFFTWVSVEAKDAKSIVASLLYFAACIAFLIPLWVNRPDSVFRREETTLTKTTMTTAT